MRYFEFLRKSYEVIEFLFCAVVLLIECNAFRRSEGFDELGKEFVFCLRFGGGVGAVCVERLFGRCKYPTRLERAQRRATSAVEFRERLQKHGK